MFSINIKTVFVLNFVFLLSFPFIQANGQSFKGN